MGRLGDVIAYLGLKDTPSETNLRLDFGTARYHALCSVPRKQFIPDRVVY